MKEVERGQLRRFQSKVVKKKRKRKRTGRLKSTLIEEIEKALSLYPSPIGHLFSQLDADGTPEAPLEGILRCLSLCPKKFLEIPDAALLAINRAATMFQLFNDAGKWIVRHRPANAHPYDCMVYLDHLPDGVTRERVLRELKKYGIVVQLRLPFRARPDTVHNGYVQPKRPRGFGFVQFTDGNAVRKLCHTYYRNLPGPIKRRNLLKLLFLKERRPRKREPTTTANMNSNSTKDFVKPLDKISQMDHCLLKSKTSTEEISLEAKTNGSLHLELASTTVASFDLLSPGPGERVRLMSTSSMASDIGDRPRCSLDAIEPSANENGKLKRKRRRRKRHFKIARMNNDAGLKNKDPAYIEGTVSKFFRQMQVLPFRTYRQLRSEYTALIRRARLRVPYELKNLQRCTAFRDEHWSIDNADDSDGMESVGEQHRED